MTSQVWDPQNYDRHVRFVSNLGSPVLELLNAQAGERILDLGCGDGVLTQKLMALGCEVVGIDTSPEMVKAARKLGVNAQVMNGEELSFNSEFDAVFSNAALHWMKRPERVVSSVRNSLRPGGLFVGECGGGANVALIRDTLHLALQNRDVEPESVDPWHFPTPESYRPLLEAEGFRVEQIQLFPRPTPLPGELLDWLEVFAGSFISALPDSERQPYLLEVCHALRPKLCDATGQWTVDYVRLRFVAHLPEQE